MLSRTVLFMDNGPGVQEDVAAVSFKTGIGDEKLTESRPSWNYILEASSEYVRIVSDLFPNDSLVRFGVTHPSPQLITEWAPLSCQKAFNLFRNEALSANIKKDELDYKGIDTHILKAGLEALASRQGLAHKRKKNLLNRGRIILINSRRKSQKTEVLQERVNLLEKLMTEMISDWNNSHAVVEGKSLPLDYCELIDITVIPNGEKDLDLCPVPCRIFSVQASQVTSDSLVNTIHRQIQENFRLRRAVISGIPMSATNNKSKQDEYDVVLLFPGGSGIVVEQHKETAASSLKGKPKQAKKPVPSINEITLTWKKGPTKKANSVILPSVTVHRVSPIDLYGGATTCLFKHLLGGSHVMLVQDALHSNEKTGKSKATHALMTHKGVVFLHFLDASLTLLDSLPSIQDCAGGQIQDYRSSALRDLISQNMLLGQDGATQSRMSSASLKRETIYFPLVHTQALALEHPLLASVMKALQSENIDRATLEVCMLQAENFNNASQQNEERFFPELSDKKRRLAYTKCREELKDMTSKLQGISENHNKLATALLDTEATRSTTPDMPPTTLQGETAFAELDRINNLSHREREDIVSGDTNNAHRKFWEQPHAVGNKERPTNPGYCYDFNNFGECARGQNCKFLHEDSGNMSQGPLCYVCNQRGHKSRECPHQQDGTSETKEETIRLKRQLVDFARTKQKEIQFPKTLTSSERRVVHEKAEELGLQHETRIVQGARIVHVWHSQDLPTESVPSESGSKRRAVQRTKSNVGMGLT
eukprot:m.105345 g.105345  ORF g.105345 m.105345 type:complete len:765 (-) comp13871_c0_seq1:4044-6338(-)